MQRPAAFYLNSGEDPMFGEPTLTIAGNVAEVLFAQGVMAELSERLRLKPGFKQHEGHVVPADCLGRLASVCRDVADRYDDADAMYEGPTFRMKRQSGGKRFESTVVAAASGAEIHTALTQLGNLAHEGASQGVAVLADL
jgi:hypothetical protein